MVDKPLDLRVYLRIAARWWWVFLVGLVVPTVVAFFITGAPDPLFSAQATVLVEGRQTPGLPTANDIAASRTLASNYRDVVTTRTVLERVVNELALPYGPDALAGKITVKSPRSLITIEGRDADPALAVAITNTTAKAFIADQQDRQLTQIASFQNALTQYGLSQDSTAFAAQIASVRVLSVLEDARSAASATDNSARTRNMVLAAILGLVLSVGVVYVFEHLDDSVKSPEELRELTGLSSLGTIPREPKWSKRGNRLLAQDDSSASLLEQYKFVRANLEFSVPESGTLRTILVTSAGPQEGKSVTATNLAVAVAKEGRTVILLDCDLRRPSLHEKFGVTRDAGLMNVLMGGASLDDVLQPTPIDGLRLLVSGPIPPDPTPALVSPVMRATVQQLADMVDLVIIDSGPVLAVTDPLLIATFVDGVALVIDAHKTRKGALQHAVESIRQATPSLLGVVFNKVNVGARSYYHRHYYYNYEQTAQASRSKIRPGTVSGE